MYLHYKLASRPMGYSVFFCITPSSRVWGGKLLLLYQVWSSWYLGWLANNSRVEQKSCWPQPTFSYHPHYQLPPPYAKSLSLPTRSILACNSDLARDCLFRNKTRLFCYKGRRNGHPLHFTIYIHATLMEPLARPGCSRHRISVRK